MKKNLVVVRAGKNSLHRRWLDLPYEQRGYELLISYFSEAAYSLFTPSRGVRAVLIKGGKWDGLYNTLLGEKLGNYDFFWFPDDDLDIAAQDVNTLFRMARVYDLRVAQPSLTHDSYFSHFIFSQCPDFRIRYTNYIEIMAPCLHRAILERVLPLFENTMSGYGLDYIWCRLPESGAFRVAILDQIAMRHTRPVGKELKSAIAASGRPDSEQEEIALKCEFELDRRTVPLVFAGLLEDGQPVAGRARMALSMCRNWLPVLPRFRSKTEARAGVFKVVRRQLTKPMDMTTISQRQIICMEPAKLGNTASGYCQVVGNRL